MGAGPYGCSYAPVFLKLIRLANPLLKYANVCGPPLKNQCTSIFQPNKIMPCNRYADVDLNLSLLILFLPKIFVYSWWQLQNLKCNASCYITGQCTRTQDKTNCRQVNTLVNNRFQLRETCHKKCPNCYFANFNPCLIPGLEASE